MRISLLSALLLAWVLAAGAAGASSRPNSKADAASAARQAALRGAWGTYDRAPYVAHKVESMLPEPRMDIDRLIKELVDLHVNTYCFLIWHHAVDWVELHRFLPEARKHGIQVWVYLTPPTEQPPLFNGYGYSEPFGTDYLRWARELARLSLEEPNLTAWCIDDFAVAGNLKLFTPDYIRKMVTAARQINPKLAFMPCIYNMSEDGKSLKAYAGLFDGILLCHNLQDENKPMAEHRAWMQQNVKLCKEYLGKACPVISFQFVMFWSMSDPSPEHTRNLLTMSRDLADGCLAYLHPLPEAKNREAIQETFAEFAREHAWGRRVSAH